MSKLKKVLLMCTAHVLVAALAISGTVAYLTSTDSDVNVMTLGNVKIAQHEYQRVIDADGNYKTDTIDDRTSYVLEAFEQGKALLPATDPTNNGAGPYDATTVRMLQVDSYGGMQVFTNSNAQDKFVTVENTGKTNAYIRTLVAIECGEGDASLIGSSYHQTWEPNEIGVIEVDGNKYCLTEYIYKGGQLSDGSWRHENGILPAGDTSYPNLSQVYLKAEATNEDCEALDGNGNGTLDILVLSQAVQAAGFADSATALNEGFGAVTAEKAAEWFGSEEFRVPIVVYNADELIEALENGEDVVLNNNVKIDPAKMSNAYGKTGINVKNGQTIDGNGYTVDIQGAGGTWDSGINTTGGVIKNITITGSFRGVFVNHTSAHSEPVVLENVIIDGTTYTISCDQGLNQNLVATDSTFNGWTSFAKTLGTASFENCSFGEGNGYAYCRPYAPTTFVGCDFEAGYIIDARAAVTFENCTFGGVALNADNLAMLMTSSSIANASIK